MGRHKTYDRDEVLERALTLFWEKGYEGTHLQQLVDTTGLNRFSLYKEFGGKEGLFAEAVSRYMGQLGSLAAYLQKEPPGVANVHAYFQALVDFKFRHGCFLVNTLSEKHVVGPGVYRQILDFVRAGGKLLEKNLQASRERGELDAGVDVESLAGFLVAFELGFLTYGIVEPRKAQRRRTLDFLERVLR